MTNDAANLLKALAGTPRIAFDLDGTLYDTRDFERPALASVVAWLCARSGRALQGLGQSLWSRRENDRHRPGLFDELLANHELPVEWGEECAALFHDYPGNELRQSESLKECLSALRVANSRLALVSNGWHGLQSRKLELLGIQELFDICVYCEPRDAQQRKPSSWAWGRLAAWRETLPTAYVGDDPVDAEFARAGGARFVSFRFRSASYED